MQILTPTHCTEAQAHQLTTRLCRSATRRNIPADDLLDVLESLGLTAPVSPALGGRRDGLGRLRTSEAPETVRLCGLGLHNMLGPDGRRRPDTGALYCGTCQATKKAAETTPKPEGMCRSGEHPKTGPGRCTDCKNARSREGHARKRESEGKDARSAA